MRSSSRLAGISVAVLIGLSSPIAAESLEQFNNISIDSNDIWHYLEIHSEHLAPGQSYVAGGYIHLGCSVPYRSMGLLMNFPGAWPLLMGTQRVRIWTEKMAPKEFLLEGPRLTATLLAQSDADTALHTVYEAIMNADELIAFEVGGHEAKFDAHTMPAARARFLQLCPWNGAGQRF